MSYPVRLLFACGEQRTLQVGGDESVCQGVLRQGLRLLTDCLEGACGTCRARLLSGEVDLGDPGLDALSPAEEAAGCVLLCQASPRSPLVVELPYALALAEGRPPEPRVGRLAVLEPRGGPGSPRLWRIVIDPEAPLAFVPGQYGRFRFPGQTDAPGRAFSFASLPGDAIELWVRALPDGAFSRYLAERARPGDRIRFEAPFGTFHLRPGSARRVFVTGGTGIAPVLSQLRSLSRRNDPAPALLLHGANVREELPGEAVFAALREAGLGLEIRLALTDPPPAWPGHRGLVTDLLEPGDVEEGTDYHLCGPPPMVEAATARLLELGAPEARIHAEAFEPA